MVAFFIGLANLIIKALGLVASAIVYILPPSPFHIVESTPIADYLQGVNWIIPVDAILSAGSLWLSAIAIYYIYQAVLRWVKLIK